MRVLILGGTGFIGRRTVAALRDHEVTLFHRGTGYAEQPGARHLYGDRRQLASFRAKFSALRPDVVLDMNAQNAEDARAALDAVKGATERIVAVSSLSVYRTFGVLLGTETGPIDNTPRTEDAPLRSRLFPYRGDRSRPADDPKRWLDGYDKIPAEAALLSQSEIGGSILRLPMVYGADDPDLRIASYVDRMAGGGTIYLRESAAAWRHSRVHVDNAARAIALAVVGGALGRIYNIAEPEDWTESDWIGRIGRCAGWTGRLEIVPDASADGRPMIDEFPESANFAQHLRVDSGRIRRELAYDEAISPDQALYRTVLSIQARSA